MKMSVAPLFEENLLYGTCMQERSAIFYNNNNNLFSTSLQENKNTHIKHTKLSQSVLNINNVVKTALYP